MSCMMPECHFRKDLGAATEEQLECKNRNAQMSIELRSASDKKGFFCPSCNRKTAAKVGEEAAKFHDGRQCTRYGSTRVCVHPCVASKVPQKCQSS